MSIDPSIVKSIATETGFDDEIIEQVLNLKSILKMLSEDPLLSGKFVLIGGTAINLFDKDLPRLSVDIDLDYIHKDKTEFIPDLIEKHKERFDKIAKALSMNMFDKRKEKTADRLRLIFEYPANFSRDTGTIKLDISYLMKSTVFKPVNRKVEVFCSSDPFKTLKYPVADNSDLWAGKTLALVYKTSKDPDAKEVSDLYSMQIARHLFDVSRFQTNLQKRKVSIDKKSLRLAFIIKGVPRLRDLYLLSGEGIRKCSEKQLKTELDPYLRQSGDGDVRLPLDKMIKLCREFLFIVCSNSWTKKEVKFVEEFQEKGNYKPELLFNKNSKEYKILSKNVYLQTAAKKILKK